jgi:hypothetical protein
MTWDTEPYGGAGVSDLLKDPLVVLYFQPEAGLSVANADLVVKGMQEAILVGERHLAVDENGGVSETKATTDIPAGAHFGLIRLPNKYQTDQVFVTCPDCHFTYTHQHIFAEGTK